MGTGLDLALVVSTVGSSMIGWAVVVELRRSVKRFRLAVVTSTAASVVVGASVVVRMLPVRARLVGAGRLLLEEKRPEEEEAAL